MSGGRQFTNFGEEVLSVGINSTATTMTLVGVSSLPTAAPFYLEVWNYTDYGDSPGDDPDVEFVDVLEFTTGTKIVDTMVRGVNGTSAAAHNTGGKTYHARLAYSANDAAGFRSVVSITEFGADTAKADNAAFIQDAFDYAHTNKCEVYIPAGTFTTTEVDVGADVPRIFGAGVASILEQKDWAENVLDSEDSNGCIVENLFFQGKATTTEARQDDNNGLYFGSSAGTPATGDVGKIVIRNCTFKQFRNCGAAVTYSDSVIVSDCDFDTCMHGLLAYYNSDVRITGNRLNESMASGQATPELVLGISIDGTSATYHNTRVLISGNSFDAWKYGQAILVHDGDSIVASNNRLDDVLIGISVNAAASETDQVIRDINISDNVVRHDLNAPTGATAGGSGILISGGSAGHADCERIVISGNSVYGANIGATDQSQAAISVWVQANQVAITDNVIDYVGGQGIYLYQKVNDLNMSGNVIHDINVSASRQYGIFIQDATGLGVSGLIANNTIDDADTGIYIASGSDVTGLSIGDNSMTNVTTRVSNNSSDIYLPLGYSGAYATIYTKEQSGGEPYQTLTTAGTWYPVTQFVTNGVSKLCTADATNNRITVLVGGVYLVTFYASFSGTSGANTDFAISIDGTESDLRCRRKLGTGTDVGTTLINTHLQINAGSHVTVEVTADSNGDDVNIYDGALSLTLVGR